MKGDFTKMSELDKTLDNVINSQPEISDGVSNEKSSGDYRDNYGRSFDPSIHLADDSGSPQLTKKGKLRVKQGKSPSKISKSNATSQKPESYRQCAEVVCGTIFGFGQLVAGDEAAPSKQQAEFMIGSYERYFESKQIEDIPPGLAVFMSTVAYAVPVGIIAMKKQDSKLNKAAGWVKKKLFGRKPKEVKTKE